MLPALEMETAEISLYSWRETQASITNWWAGRIICGSTREIHLLILGDDRTGCTVSIPYQCDMESAVYPNWCAELRLSIQVVREWRLRVVFILIKWWTLMESMLLTLKDYSSSRFCVYRSDRKLKKSRGCKVIGSDCSKLKLSIRPRNVIKNILQSYS